MDASDPASDSSSSSSPSSAAPLESAGLSSSGFWGRAEVVRHALSLLVAIAFSHPEAHARFLALAPERLLPWLRRILLQAPEPNVRKEACFGFYRLVMGTMAGSSEVPPSSAALAAGPATPGKPFLSRFLGLLLKLLPYAQTIPMPSVLDGSSSAWARPMDEPHTPPLFPPPPPHPPPPRAGPPSSARFGPTGGQGSGGGKDPYGPSSKDYFWLVSRLLDHLPKKEESGRRFVDVDALAHGLARSIRGGGVGDLPASLPPAHEKGDEVASMEVEDPPASDDAPPTASPVAAVPELKSFSLSGPAADDDLGLNGTISLLTACLKHNPPFKFSPAGRAFLSFLFDSLFAPGPSYLSSSSASTSRRHSTLIGQSDHRFRGGGGHHHGPPPLFGAYPSSSSSSRHASGPFTAASSSSSSASPIRSACYDVMIELIKGSFGNFVALADKLCQQHCRETHDRSYPWDYWPDEDARSSCDFVGLTNLGATCYMASCMQHLFMVGPAKRGILAGEALAETTQHRPILVELQKLFAFLSASERKAYHPKSFCKVYTMDKQPLNTGEQKDMTEFFTDLITKLEEMNPRLKSLVKDLFGGVITNNVVSLDCDHVSQTVSISHHP